MTMVRDSREGIATLGEAHRNHTIVATCHVNWSADAADTQNKISDAVAELIDRVRTSATSAVVQTMSSTTAGQQVYITIIFAIV